MQKSRYTTLVKQLVQGQAALDTSACPKSPPACKKGAKTWQQDLREGTVQSSWVLHTYGIHKWPTNQVTASTQRLNVLPKGIHKISIKLIVTIHGLHSHVSVLLRSKMDKGVVLDFLHSFNWCVDWKSFLYLCLSSGEHQVTNIEDLHLYGKVKGERERGRERESEWVSYS